MKNSCTNFFNPNDWRFTSILKSNYDGLLADFKQFDKTEWISNNQQYIDTVGTWDFIPFIGKGTRYEKFIQKCPTVSKLISLIPIYDNCAFSIMGPGAEIKPHKGHPGDHLRVHMGLITTGEASITVGNKTEFWREKEVLIFDDRDTHSTLNPSTQYRVVFLFDILSKEYYNNFLID